MKIDTALMPSTFEAAAKVAREAEEMGLDGLWSAETSHDPFFPLVVAARETKRIQLGTGVAIVFPRSPMVLANICWDFTSQLRRALHARAGHPGQGPQPAALQRQMGKPR